MEQIREAGDEGRNLKYTMYSASHLHALQIVYETHILLAFHSKVVTVARLLYAGQTLTLF